MTTVRSELAYWAAAARGALEWHAECGDFNLEVPVDFQLPPLGRIEQAPLPEGYVAPPATARAAPAEPLTEPTPVAPSLSRLGPAAAESLRAPAPETGPAGDQPVRAPAPREAPAAGERAEAAAQLRVLADEIGPCERCEACQGRQEVVFGVGVNPRPGVLFVADAPGPLEDDLGVPFADEPGRLLNKMIRAMGLSRSAVYLTYVTKCRPSGSAPSQDSVDACRGFFERQLRIIRPEVVVALGEVAARALLGGDRAMPRMRGTWGEFEGVAVLPTFHPLAVVQNSRLKGPVWQDLKKVMRRLSEGPPASE